MAPGLIRLCFRCLSVHFEWSAVLRALYPYHNSDTDRVAFISQTRELRHTQSGFQSNRQSSSKLDPVALLPSEAMVISCCQSSLSPSLSDPESLPSRQPWLRDHRDHRHPRFQGGSWTPRVKLGLQVQRQPGWFPQETHLYLLSTLPGLSLLLPVLEETAEAKGHKFEN